MQPILMAVLGVTSLGHEYKTPKVWADNANSLTTDTMTSLTAKDKETVKAFWAKMASKAQDIGADALNR